VHRVWNNETICTSGTNYADGQWHTVAHVIGASSGGQKIYVDGVAKVSGTKSASDFNGQTGVNIGFSNDATNNYFDGLIDHVLIVKKALDATGIADLISEVPALGLHLDEPLLNLATSITTTSFANVADPTLSGGCVISPTQTSVAARPPAPMAGCARRSCLRAPPTPTTPSSAFLYRAAARPPALPLAAGSSRARKRTVTRT